MNMLPKKIRIRLMIIGVTQADIAKKLNVSQSAVSRVIDGEMVSERIRSCIAKEIGIDVKKIWPSPYTKECNSKNRGSPKNTIRLCGLRS